MFRRFRHIVFVLAYLFSHIWAGSVYSADPQTGTAVPEQNSVLIDNKIAEAEKRLEKKFEMYSEAQISKIVEAKYYAAEIRMDKQADRYFNNLNKLYDETKWAFGTLIAVALFLFWRHGKNVNDLIEKQFEETKLKVSDGIAKLDLMKQELQDKSRDVEKLKSDLDSALKPLLAYKHKKIVWAYETANMDDNSEIEYIRSKKFQVAVCQPGEEKVLPPDKCDLMIYSFCKSDKSVDRLNEIISFLKSVGRDVPLIIYTYNSGAKRLEQELAILNDYKNYVMANMPLTLKSQFDSLIRL